MSRFILIPLEAGKPTEIKIPSNLIQPIKSESPDILQSLFKAFAKADISRDERGMLCHNEEEMGVEYDEFINDCCSCKFSKQYEEVYNLVCKYGFMM